MPEAAAPEAVPRLLREIDQALRANPAALAGRDPRAALVEVARDALRAWLAARRPEVRVEAGPGAVRIRAPAQGTIAGLQQALRLGGHEEHVLHLDAIPCPTPQEATRQVQVKLMTAAPGMRHWQVALLWRPAREAAAGPAPVWTPPGEAARDLRRPAYEGAPMRLRVGDREAEAQLLGWRSGEARGADAAADAGTLGGSDLLASLINGL